MIDLKTNKTYCPFLFRAANLSMPQSEIVPCCRYERSKDEYETSFKNGYNSLWKDLRKKAINGEKIQGCWRCYQEEDAGMKSMRTGALSSESDPDQEIPYRSQQEIEYQSTKLEFLEIQTGRYCNLKCRSCGPNLSTTWDEDLDKSDMVIKNFYGNDVDRYDQIKRLPKTNKGIANIPYDIVKDLKNIKATGGEPFLNDQFQIFLANLVEWDLAKNISIEVFTNCSFFPKDAFRKLLPYFKKIKVTLSLDGIGPRAEFLRKGSQWPKVLESANGWKKCMADHQSIHISISHTVTIFNVLYLKEFITWMESFFKKEILQNRFEFDLHLAQTPEYLSVYNFDNKVKKNISTILSNDFDNSKDSYISKILSVLKKDNVKNIEQEFFEKTKLFDTIRNENWRQTFPELAEVLG